MAGISVFLAMPTTRDIPPKTVLSLLDTQARLLDRGIDFRMAMVEGGSIIQHARNKCATEFLATDCTHLFWVDSDITWKPDAFLRLLALATKLDCVCAAYRKKQDELDFMVVMNDPDKPVSTNEYGCFQIKGLGFGFSVFQRKVIQAVADKAPRIIYDDVRGPEPEIFDCAPKNGRAVGEDISFFAKVRDCGFSVWMEPTIRLGHIGPKEYVGAFVDQITRL